MIPDKIYVREYPDGLNQFWDRKKRDDVAATIYHEYISKDSLLEWLNKAKIAANNDGIRAGFQIVIDKIK